MSAEIPHITDLNAPHDFEWDDVKAAANAAKHGVRFEVATAVFKDPGRADFDATRIEDGEDRRKTVGMIQGRLFNVVYATRGAVTRIISARRSNATEKRCYADGQVHPRPGRSAQIR